MGTEVQSKMYFPGYYSIQNLSSTVGHGSWSLLQENKNLKNGQQQYDIFSTKPVLDGFHGSNKEQLRQTILKHESIFQHQLNELHRLYERQKDLMNEIKSKELLKHQKPPGASQSTFSSSAISQSYSDSRGKKPRRRFFNLELPAEEYISDGEESEGVLMVSGTENCPQTRDKVLLNHIGEMSGYKSSALRPGLERSNGLTDLNEPIQNDEEYEEEIERRALSANGYKGVWPFTKKFPENPEIEKDGRVSNLHLNNETREEWSTNALKAEQTGSSAGGKFCLQDFNKPCETEVSILPSDQTKTEKRVKSTIFGIEISEGDISSVTLQQRTEVMRDRLLIDCNSMPSTPSLKAEDIHPDGVSFRGKLEADESQACHPSQGRLRWLESVPLCNGKSSKENEGSHQVKIDSLYKCSKQFVNRIDLRKGPPPSPIQNNGRDSRQQIDLNACLIEEEAQMTGASPTMRTENVIDLEAPVTVDTDRVPPVDSGLMRVAAEALVAISSQAHEHASCDGMDHAPEDDSSLNWFVDIISSHNGILSNENEEPLEVMDYFEHMTLNLVETKEEKPYYKPPEADTPKEDVTLSKRPRRVQARRGRQRKDFQKDVLPGIASLSRNEVTEDLQLIEGLIRETGGSWQSGLSQRNGGKSGRGRGRKRMVTSAPVEQPKCEEVQAAEETNLRGWGKRTRRPPRQRYPIDNSPVGKK